MVMPSSPTGNGEAGSTGPSFGREQLQRLDDARLACLRLLRALDPLRVLALMGVAEGFPKRRGGGIRIEAGAEVRRERDDAGCGIEHDADVDGVADALAELLQELVANAENRI